ncbi:hypothetical protein AU156_gp157 [Edwardsiella phage PEi20]|uniref:Uncharacterized protein n=2 Tax=Kanagawavirus pei20 TaxID=2844109 RepID=A0A0B6VT62_9CAUD|nr:hypothetical protein AU156_gp157 [Edwardsiella phage PEi20]BAQ22945.1 hypothetical protein [Edwardsiella phage PEi20]BAQ23245.1 hypothetical protein [Edwardsiella phage PEi26]
MEFIKYFVNGLLFSLVFVLGFNTPYWLGLNDVHITISSERK